MRFGTAPDPVRKLPNFLKPHPTAPVIFKKSSEVANLAYLGYEHPNRDVPIGAIHGGFMEDFLASGGTWVPETQYSLSP